MPGIRQRYAVVTEQSWELARAGYVSGLSARVVCERFGMGEANLRKRARQQGWTKRAWAAAKGGAGAAPDPLAAAATADTPPPEPPEPPESDLLEAVLRRARSALTAGRGGEASALLKATREYVIVQQDVADARRTIAEAVGIWDTAQPARAGEATETLLVQTLHDRWSGLDEHALAERIDPDGKMGLRAFVQSVDPEGAARSRRRR